jgi:uncharacterized repeat protein (TIGR03803 family)
MMHLVWTSGGQMSRLIQCRRHVRRRSQAALCEVLESRVLLSSGPYTFSSVAGFQGKTNGTEPQGLVMDDAGNLYGVTARGGSHNYGTIFKIAAGTTTIETLATFAGPTKVDPDNGISPRGNLVLDAAGNLYGITTGGGEFGKGTVWELPATASSMIVTLASFDGANGAYPFAGLVTDGAGNLFGTTVGSRHKGDASTVFEVAVDPDNATNSTIEALAIFSYKDQLSGQLATYASGDSRGQLVVDSGNIFGTTERGGAKRLGSIFQISSDHTVTTLVSFIGRGQSALPSGTLLGDADGNLIGLSTSSGSSGRGGIFEFFRSSSTLTTLASFKGSDGTHPLGTLIMDDTGNLFGTTSTGGSKGRGTVFELPATSSAIMTLYSFQSSSAGAYSTGPLVLDPSGNLWGATYLGGKSNNKGTIFVLLNNVHLAITQQPTSVVSGAPFTLVVNIQDASNNLVPIANGKITVKVFSAPRGGRLLGTRTVSLVNGVATFSGLALKGVGDYTLEVLGNMLTTVMSVPITVTAAG